MLCENHDGKVLAGGCYSAQATHSVKITYSKSEFGEASDVLLLCTGCFKTIREDAESRGYKVQFSFA